MRIGFFRTCGLGDAVQLTPLLRQARADYPEAEIVLFVSHNAGALFRGCPYVDHTEALPQAWFLPHPLLRKPLYTKAWSFMRHMGPWDYFLTLEPRWYRNFGLWSVPAKVKAGTVITGRPGKFLYHHYTEKKWGGSPGVTTHQSERYLELWTKATGQADRGYGYDLSYLPEPHEPSAALPKPYVCLAPGCGNFMHQQENKKWPLQHWKKLARRIVDDTDAAVIWLGARGEAPPKLTQDCGISLIGKTNLIQSVSIIRHSSGLVGNDSGLFHIAQGLGTPAAAFFGPTESGFTGTFRTKRSIVFEDKQLPCQPCFQDECRFEGSLPKTPLSRPYCQALLTPELIWPKLRYFFHL